MRAVRSPVRVFRQTLLDDTVERCRRQRLHGRHGTRLVLEDRTNEAGLTRPLKRLVPRNHLEHDRAKGENVRPGVGVLALQLLRGHVLQRAEDLSFTGQGRTLRGHG